MPLAHILLPQLARKAQEIENAIGPPRATGYLQASAPVQRQYHPVEMSTPAAMRGELPVRREKAPASEKGLAELRSRPAPRPDQVFKAAAAREANKAKSKSKIKLIPNAPSPDAPVYAPARGTIQVAPGEPIGQHEDGRSIYATEAPPKPTKKGKRTIIQLPDGAVGSNERGEALAAGGKNLGYLQDPNTRTLGRRANDISLGAQDTFDQFGAQTLQRKYGEFLEAARENRVDGKPTDRIPASYLQGMSSRQKCDIEAGVARLRELEQGRSL
jgi:hypothetical protein